MKKVIGFIVLIAVIFGALTFITVYEKQQKVAGNPFQKDDLHQATVDQLDNPHYQNQILPDELSSQLESEESLTVYFYSPTCQHCRRTTPVVVPMTESMEIDLQLFNLVEFEDGWNDYGIKSTPTIVHYENGEETARIVGAKPESTFQQWFEQKVQ